MTLMVHVRNQPGLVVLDASCYRFLRRKTVRDLVDGNLRAADLRLVPSALNVLELSTTPDKPTRQALLKTAGTIADGCSLLPWPSDLLARIGRAILDGEHAFLMEQTGLEWVLEEPYDVPDTDRAAFSEFMTGMEHAFAETHKVARPMVQAFLKERGLRGTWEDAGRFLDEQWSRLDQLDTLIDGIWGVLGLPGGAPRSEVLDNRAFSILFDALGVAVFERCVSVNQPKQVQLSDLLQLVYLGGNYRSILVTNDGQLLRAGRAVVENRYENARVMSWADFVE